MLFTKKKNQNKSGDERELPQGEQLQRHPPFFDAFSESFTVKLILLFCFLLWPGKQHDQNQLQLFKYHKNTTVLSAVQMQDIHYSLQNFMNCTNKTEIDLKKKNEYLGRQEKERINHE